MEKQNQKPIISIAIPVYNHELYIAKAIESVLMQKTSFAIEIIIGDDCSTDKTREILIDFKEKHPDKIKLILAEQNQGVLKNTIDIYNNCTGKYIAILDGDDYWTNENKLQKQINFLEENEEYKGCFHDTMIISEQEEGTTKQNQYHTEFKYYSQFNKYSTDFYSYNIIERNIIPTSSFVFRNTIDLNLFFKKFADLQLSLLWAMQIFIVGRGKLRYFNEAWSVYNDHPKGVSKAQSLNTFKLSNIKVLKRYAKEKDFKYLRNSIYKTITNEYRQILLNPQNKKSKKSFYYKTIFQYGKYYLKTFAFELFNLNDYHKNLKDN